MRLLTLLLIALTLALPPLARAEVEETRVALVIGNSRYEHETTLPNPENDARATARALAEIGYDVTAHYDLTQSEIYSVLSDFKVKIQDMNADTAVVYYAGRGWRANGISYLIPVDTNFTNARDLMSQSVRLENVVSIVERGARQWRVTADICCDDPPYRLEFSRRSGPDLAPLVVGPVRVASPMQTRVIAIEPAPPPPPPRTRVIVIRPAIRPAPPVRPPEPVRVVAPPPRPRRPEPVRVVAPPPPPTPPTQPRIPAPPRLRPAIPAAQPAPRERQQPVSARISPPAPPPLTPAQIAQRDYRCETDGGAQGVSFAEKCWPLTTTKIEAGDIPYSVRHQITDAAPLAALTALQGLFLGNTQVSDLTPLQAMTALKELSLSGAQVSDLTPLQGITGLRVLYLRNTQVSDLTPLQGMTALQSLYLSGAPVSDLTPLQGMTGLQVLYLRNTQVSDLTPLQGMTGLQVLYLRNTQVSDLTPLQGMTGLQVLYLRNTQVSDLTPLQGMTRLHWLWTPDGQDHGDWDDTPENRAAVARAIREWRPQR